MTRPVPTPQRPNPVVIESGVSDPVEATVVGAFVVIAALIIVGSVVLLFAQGPLVVGATVAFFIASYLVGRIITKAGWLR